MNYDEREKLGKAIFKKFYASKGLYLTDKTKKRDQKEFSISNDCRSRILTSIILDFINNGYQLSIIDVVAKYGDKYISVSTANLATKYLLKMNERYEFPIIITDGKIVLAPIEDCEYKGIKSIIQNSKFKSKNMEHKPQPNA